MNPGEYIGKDGRTYRWGKNAAGRLWTEVWDKSFPRWITASMDPPDWPAAKAALDALIESQKDEGRRIPLACFGGRFELVLRRELGKSEIRMASDGTVAYPTGNDVSVFAAAAYQKGHKDGLTERGDS